MQVEAASPAGVAQGMVKAGHACTKSDELFSADVEIVVQETVNSLSAHGNVASDPVEIEESAVLGTSVGHVRCSQSSVGIVNTCTWRPRIVGCFDADTCYAISFHRAADVCHQPSMSHDASTLLQVS